jgi:hypothetical protein
VNAFKVTEDVMKGIIEGVKFRFNIIFPFAGEAL